MINELDDCYHCHGKNGLKEYDCWVTLHGPFGEHTSMLVTGLLCCLNCKAEIDAGQGYTHVASFDLSDKDQSLPYPPSYHGNRKKE